MNDELLDTVNSHDEVVGTQLRSKVHAQGLTCFRAINGLIINDQGKLWIPRRTQDKELYPLALDASVGGHVSSGETYDQAFERELYEELNLRLEEQVYEMAGKLNPAQNKTSAFMQIYIIWSNQEPDYNRSDFCEFYWITPNEFLNNTIHSEYVKSDLPIIIKFIQTKYNL